MRPCCSAALLAGCAPLTWRQQLQSEDPLGRIDGAVAAARAKDRSAVPLLVDRLQDDDVAVRMCAIMALEKIEGTSLGYKYWADDMDRARMAQHWRDYLKGKHQGPDTTASPATQPLGRRAETTPRFGCHGPVDAARRPRTRAVLREIGGEVALAQPLATTGGPR